MDERFGVVQFEEARPDSRGWASINGEKSFLVRGTGDLTSDVTWWTNLDYDSFVKSGLVSDFRLRRSDYLRAKMEQLVEELGLVEAVMSRAQSTEILSEIFARTMHLAIERYKIKPTFNTLAGDIRHAIMGEDKELGMSIDQAADCAYQTFHKCERNPRHRKYKITTFRRPRVNHALDVLATPVPTRQWQFLGMEDIQKISRDSSQVLEWILKQDRPALVQAAVLETTPVMAPIVAFGSGASVARNWISHPELLLLSKFCKIKIRTAFLASGYERLDPRVPFSAVEGMDTLSISHGLLAENYWIAAASPQPPQMGSRIVTPTSVWLRASDRAHCFMPAMILHQAGLPVSMYGMGAVSVAVPTGNMDRAIEVAAEAGLMPPLSARDDMRIQQDLA